MKTQFKAAWWLRNPHLQTIWPALMKRKVKHLSLWRERVELPDGDFIDTDWVVTSNKGPFVLILHGLEGSINSHYAKSMLAQVERRGWRGVFMHFRGCSGEPNRLPRGYHSGETKDLSYMIQLIQTRYPGVPISVVGYSLGGNVLLKWLGETGETNPLAAAIAVSVPFELHKAANRIQLGFSRFYQWHFLRCLRERLMEKFQQVSPGKLDPVVLADIQTIRDFDNKVTAPLHGFASAEDYYSISSSRQYLSRITVPTLIVHAKDDPFMSQDVIPAGAEIAPSVQLELTERGGHVGFIGGIIPGRPRYWLDERLPVFLSDHI